MHHIATDTEMSRSAAVGTLSRTDTSHGSGNLFVCAMLLLLLSSSIRMEMASACWWLDKTTKIIADLLTILWNDSRPSWTAIGTKYSINIELSLTTNSFLYDSLCSVILDNTHGTSFLSFSMVYFWFMTLYSLPREWRNVTLTMYLEGILAITVNVYHNRSG